MVEDAHQVVMLVSRSSDLLALIHGRLLLLVAPFVSCAYPRRGRPKHNVCCRSWQRIVNACWKPPQQTVGALVAMARTRGTPPAWGWPRSGAPERQRSPPVVSEPCYRRAAVLSSSATSKRQRGFDARSQCSRTGTPASSAIMASTIRPASAWSGDTAASEKP